MTGKGIGNGVLAGHDTARVQQFDRTDRDQKALTNLRRIAPDDHQLIADMLGLTGPADRKISQAPLIEPGDGKYVTGRRRRDRMPESTTGLPQHGTYARYGRGCHCGPCDQAGRDYRDDLKAQKAGAA